MELEEAIKECEKLVTILPNFHLDGSVAIETVLEVLKIALQALDNSISKKKIEDKIRELEAGIINCDRYDYYSEYDCTLLVIRLLEKLLEDK